jgi:hypothetical protein
MVGAGASVGGVEAAVGAEAVSVASAALDSAAAVDSADEVGATEGTPVTLTTVAGASARSPEPEPPPQAARTTAAPTTNGTTLRRLRTGAAYAPAGCARERVDRVSQEFRPGPQVDRTSIRRRRWVAPRVAGYEP